MDLTETTYFILIIAIILCWNSVLYSVMFATKRFKRKRKGEKRKMPTEMLKEFLDKDCTITLFNEIVGVQGRIVAIEENWIKVEEKKRTRIINGDMIRDISISRK